MPVGSQSTPRAHVSLGLQLVALAPRFLGSFQESTAAVPVVVMSSTAASSCVAPPTVVKLPIITAWVRCGLTANCTTFVTVVVVMIPDTLSWVPFSAPVTGSTNASAVTSVPPRLVKFPPSHSVPLTYLTSFTAQPLPAEQTLALNGFSDVPAVLIAATPRRPTPAAPGPGAYMVNLPDTYSVPAPSVAIPVTVESL